MPSERDNKNSGLKLREYNISGNVFRAYYDADDKLVFVIDYTIDERKPNALLVVNPVGDRKWDDILANDYAVDLETVRPKKDNKYQKLDIEYSGLGEYDDLIHAYTSGGDLSDALAALSEFRNAASVRSAQERLGAAEASAARARETIQKTNETISELHNRLKQLRTRMTQQKKLVGREPTKQSASKILKTDAQIDATNEKLRRAKKRLDNAQRRLIVADQDAEIAREILARDNVSGSAAAQTSVIDVLRPQTNAALPAAAARTDVMVQSLVQDEDVAASNNDNNANEYDDADYTESETVDVITEQPKADTMADEEVKPLFDKDPEILDEEIAFKPIEFGVSSPAPAQPSDNNVSQVENVHDVSHFVDNDRNISDAPLSFAPPVDNSKTEPEPVSAPVETPRTDITEPVPAPKPQSENIINETPITDASAPVNVPDSVRPINEMPNVADVQHNEPRLSGAEQNVATNVPGIAPAPATSDFRPVSPITGTAAPTNPAPRKPTLIYYVMLIILVALSIFTLWLYQRNTNKAAPDLAATIAVDDNSTAGTNAAPTDVAVSADVNAAVDSPIIPEIPMPAEPEQVEITETDITTVEQITEPDPVVMPESEPLIEPAAPVAVIETVEDTSITNDVIDTTSVAETVPEPVVEPMVPAEPEPVVPATSITVETEEEILASKPAYNVSQNEKMFVADPQYDTETLNTAVVETPTCPDGLAPDANGCCAGEIYTDMGAAGFNCCPETGGDCFPPLF